MQRTSIIFCMIFALSNFSAFMNASEKVAGKKRTTHPTEVAASAEEQEILDATQPIENDEEGIKEEHNSGQSYVDGLVTKYGSKGAFLIAAASDKASQVRNASDIDFVLKSMPAPQRIDLDRADLNYRDANNKTPLMAAAAAGNIILMHRFLEYGAIPAGLRYTFDSSEERRFFINAVNTCKATRDIRRGTLLKDLNPAIEAHIPIAALRDFIISYVHHEHYDKDMQLTVKKLSRDASRPVRSSSQPR